MSDDLDAIFKRLEGQARRGKLRRASLMQERVSGPLYPTQPQINKLMGLLGTWSRADVDAFVRFANVYEQGRLTRVHFIHAIDLAINDKNINGTAVELVMASMDPDMLIFPDTGEFQRRQIARAKGAKNPRRGNAAKLAPTMSDLDRERGAKLKALAEAVDRARAARFRDQ